MSGTVPGPLEQTKLAKGWPAPDLEKSYMEELGLELKQLVRCFLVFF